MSWDFVNTTFPRAAKPYACEECDAPIAIGEKHASVAGKCEGELMTYRLCLECAELAAAWCNRFDDGEGWPMGNLRGWLAEEGITDLVEFVADYRRRRDDRRAKRREQEGRKKAIDDLAEERIRQVEVEGWSADHDDRHSEGELAKAAAAYSLCSTGPRSGDLRDVPNCWPWSVGWWKPQSTRRNLVRAGALILAEIERLDRLAGKA